MLPRVNIVRSAVYTPSEGPALLYLVSYQRLSNTQCDYDTLSTCYICTVNIFINNARSLTDYTLMGLSSLFGQIKAFVTASSAVRYL